MNDKSAISSLVLRIFNVDAAWFVRVFGMDWSVLAAGLRRRWLTNNLVKDVARLTPDSCFSIDTFDLVLSSKASESLEILDRLTASQPSGDNRATEKLTFGILGWFYKHIDDYDDPLAIVESLYFEFDHPPAMRRFIRYQPPDDGWEPSLHSYQENIDQIFALFQRYVSDGCARFQLNI